MPFEEAFNVVGEGKEASLQVNANAFTALDESGEMIIGAEVKEVTDKLQGRLDFMKTHMKGLNTKEFDVAIKLLEDELEASIPSSFKKEYEDADSWEDAAKLVSSKVLGKVNSYIGESVKNGVRTGELKDKGENVKGDESLLARLIDIVDSESWGDPDVEEIEDIYEDVKARKTAGGRLYAPDDAVETFMARYKKPGPWSNAEKYLAQKKKLKEAEGR